VRGEQSLRTGKHAIEQVGSGRDIAEGCGVDEADEVLVERVADPEVGVGPEDGLVLRAEGCGEAFDENVDLVVRGGVAGGGAEARQAGDVLAEEWPGTKPLRSYQPPMSRPGTGRPARWR